MKHNRIIVGSFVLAMATSAYAGPFSNPRLDTAYDNLSAAAANLAMAQSLAQQNGDVANASAMAPILAMAQYTLGQLNQNVDALNASTIPSSLITSIDNQTSQATYYATGDVASPWQAQVPNPSQEAAQGQAQFEAAMGEVGESGEGGTSGGNDGAGGGGYPDPPDDELED